MYFERVVFLTMQLTSSVQIGVQVRSSAGACVTHPNFLAALLVDIGQCSRGWSKNTGRSVRRRHDGWSGASSLAAS